MPVEYKDGGTETVSSIGHMPNIGPLPGIGGGQQLCVKPPSKVLIPVFHLFCQRNGRRETDFGPRHHKWTDDQCRAAPHRVS